MRKGVAGNTFRRPSHIARFAFIFERRPRSSVTDWKDERDEGGLHGVNAVSGTKRDI